ncbi:V-type ATP synthase subunit C [Dethiobacter alkaliphilus]|uniref:H(+)-transporting two-sector ATPase n=1 Tax=Dethiobacter alkaliphilus AHT 1 TaxID=555088 RepID=C0GGW7_DETAL|nr:V-type ATP synthase subunit C [Dethiobacter alkaliphilus]EEG77558.1 H(+)-transporting two-sector ATPase [Dethiobacter alkaliphilus AHT 1]
MPSNDRYAYAVGRIRAMETRLLDHGKIERMVEAKNADEALKVLSESEYAEYLANLDSVHHFEQVLDHELRRVYLELRKISPEPELIGLFAKKFDYHNLKVLIKANKLGEKRDELLVTEVGNIALEELVRAVSDDDYSNLPPRMRQAAETISEQFRMEADPQLVDLLLDRAMYEECQELADELKSPFLKDYLTNQIDLLNIKTYLRVRRLGRPKDFLEQALLPAADVDMTKLVQLAEPLEVLVDRLMYSRYASVVEEGIQTYQKTDTLTRFEKLADDHLINMIKKAKYVTFGPEPIVGYLLAKENEIKMIRIVMVGKINQLPTEEIKERLRDVYV